jgi:hypothetical protein
MIGVSERNILLEDNLERLVCLQGIATVPAGSIMSGDHDAGVGKVDPGHIISKNRINRITRPFSTVP